MTRRLERLATVLRWRECVALEHFDASDRALLRMHHRVQRWIAREAQTQRRLEAGLERAVLRSLRAYRREHRQRVLAARRAEYAAWDAALRRETVEQLVP